MLFLAAVPAWSQTVALAGIMGQRALLVIDGAAAEVFAPGDSREGVRLVSVQSDQAVVEVGGRRQSLRVGEGPVRLSSATTATDTKRIVLHAGPGGHFIAVGQINGASVRFLVDTGATEVSLGSQQADQIGLQYRSGTQVPMYTANGAVPGYQVHLDSVKLEGVEVFNVDAIVTTSPMPFVLLGNSFLSRFQIRQENDSLTLEKRF